MEDESKPQEPPPFRWNPQAVFMALLFLALLAFPLAGVVWTLRDDMKKPSRPDVVVDTTALEKGLESMTDRHFSPTVDAAIQDTLTIEVAPADMTARGQRIAEIAKTAGGSALEMSGGDGAGPRRFMVQAPASRMDLFKRAIRGEPVDFAAIPAGSETALLEVELKAP